MKSRLPVPADALEQFCRKNSIRRLSLFGSVLKDTARPDSDLDLLVEFEPGEKPGLLQLAVMEDELSEWSAQPRCSMREDDLPTGAGAIVRDMPHTLPLPPPGFDALPVDEQIDYVQSLWDRIAASVDQVPLQEWQHALLDQRLSAHRRAPEESQPWQDVIDRIQGRLQAGR
ncbi:MAG: addiction module protein [Acidobacteriota bacterium]